MVILEQMDCSKTPKYLESDLDCVLHAQSEEHDALRVLYERHYLPVLKFIKLRVNEIEDAKDIASSVFLVVFEKIHTLKDPSNFTGWLYGIARNKLKKFYRQQHHEIKMLEASFTDRANDSIGPQAENRQVKSALQDLSVSERKILRLRFNEHLSVAEIAQQVNKSPAAVKKYLYRTRQKFEKIYQKKFLIGGEISEQNK